MLWCELIEDGLNGRVLRYRERLQDGILMGSSGKRKKEIMKKHKNSGRIRAERDML